MDQSLARPCGSTIKNIIINNPQIVISKCLAVTADKPTISTIKNLRPIGKVTTNAAPRKEPNIEPSPPIIIMNKTKNDLSIDAEILSEPDSEPDSVPGSYTDENLKPTLPDCEPKQLGMIKCL